jgi:S1-C subfamily serine protease
LKECATIRVVRLTVPLASVATASVMALGAAGCGKASEETSPGTTEGQSSALDAADLLGATLAPTTAGEPGAVVQSVEPTSTSRLKPGDVITAVNGTPVASADDVLAAFGTPELGERIRLRVVRGSHRFPLIQVPSPTAYLGANVRNATGSVTGVVVESVQKDSPAAASDLQRGDLITRVDDTPIGSVQDLLQVIGANGAGATVSIRVSRGSRQLDVTATLGERPTPGTSR